MSIPTTSHLPSTSRTHSSPQRGGSSTETDTCLRNIQTLSKENLILLARQIKQLSIFYDQNRIYLNNENRSEFFYAMKDWAENSSKKREFLFAESSECERVRKIQVLSKKIPLKESLIKRIEILQNSRSDSFTFEEIITLGKALHELSYDENKTSVDSKKRIANLKSRVACIARKGLEFQKSSNDIVRLAFTFRGVADPAFLKDFKTIISSQIPRMNAKQIGKIAYAFACLKSDVEKSQKNAYQSIYFLDFVNQSAMQIFTNSNRGCFREKDLVRFLWAHGYLKWEGYEVRMALEMRDEHCQKLIQPIIDKLNELNVSYTVRLFNTLFKNYNLKNEELAAAILKKLQSCKELVTPEEITNIISTLIKSGIKEKELLNTMLELMSRCIDRFGHGEIVTLTGSLMIKQCREDEPKTSILLNRINELASSIEEDRLGEVCMLFMLYNLLHKDRGVSIKLDDSLSDRHKTYLINNREKMKPQSSYTHKTIMTYLNEWRPGFRPECDLEIFAIDIAYEDEKIAIEVDGVHHFLQASKEYKPKEVLKEKLLELLGWTLIRIRIENYTDKHRKGIEGTDFIKIDRELREVFKKLEAKEIADKTIYI